MLNQFLIHELPFILGKLKEIENKKDTAIIIDNFLYLFDKYYKFHSITLIKILDMYILDDFSPLSVCWEGFKQNKEFKKYNKGLK
ncbi:hypothetical protein [Campylobacter pinnipediorum]|uniref:Uncharacterized protein n=1 Tax=Campylobacter pinnipediorum subsp. pinnipediorum TaxID=1660067 RepID=A0AAX0L9R9_9BACT|nr:hypothetical protein [Campylobacter pinnipediorum]OPA77360.1 hypothetical protein BFG04_04500 [Campylobacter pinnipediorum subsp. pinnipediorum]